MICTLTNGFDAATVERIQARLDEAGRDHGVRVLRTVESGGRARGFPSPGSDYDCRFFYACRHGDYLSPWCLQGVIETPLNDAFDVNGWDLVKATWLAARSSATVMEWLRSPLAYRGQPALAEEPLDVRRVVTDHDTIRRHYFHTGHAHQNRSGAVEDGKVSLKKLLYAIRPAVTLHRMRILGSPVPPMNLSAPLEETPPAEDVIDAIIALVRAKTVIRELGEGVVPEPIRRSVLYEFGLVAETGTQRLRPGIRYRAFTAFTDLLRRFAPTYVQKVPDANQQYLCCKQNTR